VAHFVTELDARALDDEHWLLLEPLVYQSGIGTITVEQGFITDLSSVPRWPLAYWLFGGRAKKAAVIHDHLYARQPCSRWLADAVFPEAAQASGIGWARRWAMWAGVRLGGGWAWAEDRRLRAATHRRG
jgi:hypothetical protein